MDGFMCFIVTALMTIVFGITAVVYWFRKDRYRKLYCSYFLICLTEAILSFFLMIYDYEICMVIGYQYSVLVLFFFVIPYVIPFLSKKYRKAYNDYYKARRKPSENTLGIREQLNQEREDWKRQLGENIVKTKYMSGHHVTTSKASTSSAVGRAVVGGAIAGDVGAIVGASTAKQKTKAKHTTTFLVFYKDGHKNLETVEDGTLQFEVYVDKLEIE